LWWPVYWNPNHIWQTFHYWCYLPPSNTCNDAFTPFQDEFVELVTYLQNNSYDCLIGEDFNINLIEYQENSNVSNCFDCLASCGCISLINKPSRFSKNSTTPSVLDHIYTNICDELCNLFFSCHVSLTIRFNDWKNMHCLSEHEGSTRHKEGISTLCMFSWQTERLKSLAAQIENKKDCRTKEMHCAEFLRGAYCNTFKTSDQIGHTCMGPKIRWPRALHSLNPSLYTDIKHGVLLCKNTISFTQNEKISGSAVFEWNYVDPKI